MAPTSDAVENTLVTAQRALAVVYEHNYPFSDTVRQGLERMLNERYGGSQQDFTTKFIRLTIFLLKNLKAKGFPLVKEGKVIAHLFAPSNHLESGEMFYQVGHTTPGTLALKFTKYQGNHVVLQPSTIKENEFHLAFTLQYIERMRNEAPRMGDQLMRILLTLMENGQGLFAVEKVEVRGIMPYSIVHCTSGPCHQPVMETGAPKCSDTSDPLNIPFGRSCSEDQTVKDDQTTLVTGHQPEENSFEGSHSPAVTNHQSEDSSRSNPAYPPLMQAVRDEAPAPAVGHQLTEQSSGTNVRYPEYPPMMQAVGNNPLEPSTGHSSEGRSSGTSVSNPEYPPMMQAVRDNDPPEPATSHPSEGQLSGTSVRNPEYPPMAQAVKDDTPEPAASHSPEGRSFGTSVSNPEYPSMMQAVRNESSMAVTEHHSGERSSSGSRNNTTYPALREAVRDYSSSARTISNATYPPLVQAVRNNPSASFTGYQSDRNHPSSSNVSNPTYPPAIQAVRDDPTAPVNGHQPQGNLPGACCDRPATSPSGGGPYMLDDDLDLF